MLLVVGSLVGCGLFEEATTALDEKVADQGIEALRDARETVRQAEASPGKRRVLRVMRKLIAEIDSGQRSGFNGNLFAAAVTRAANDGAISSVEAGVVEDAYMRLLGGEVRAGRRGARPERPEPNGPPPAEDEPASSL